MIAENGSGAGLRLTDASGADAPLMHRLMMAAFAEFHETLHPPSSALSESIDDTARALSEGGGVIVWDGDEPVGCARYAIRPGYLYAGRVAVLPEHRRRGIARLLMGAIAEHAAQLGRSEVQVEVRRSLPSNIGLYESLGYQIVREEAHPRDPSVTFVVMALPVKTSA